MDPRAGRESMRWAAAHSILPGAAGAASEVAAALEAGLGAGPVDLVVAFFGASHAEDATVIGEVLKRRLRAGCVLGCSGRGAICSAREIESGSVLSVVAARLPGVDVSPFILVAEAWAEDVDDAAGFARLAPGVAEAELVVLLGDPFTLDVERVLEAVNRHARGVRVVGGMGSAGARPGANALILNDWVAREGGVAVALKGALRVDVVVSQGCRPVGPALTVTRVEGNLILELDGRPALERAEQVLLGLAETERQVLKHGLYVGRPVRPGAEGRGDYLIRNLLGADRNRGVIAIADPVSRDERIRLHVRDARAAREDLELLLAPQEFDAPPGAALLFACNGRGRALHHEPDGDISILQAALAGPVPAAGMFCAGEVGPVGGRNFLHGHTASVAIVRER